MQSKSFHFNLFHMFLDKVENNVFIKQIFFIFQNVLFLVRHNFFHLLTRCISFNSNWEIFHTSLQIQLCLWRGHSHCCFGRCEEHPPLLSCYGKCSGGCVVSTNTRATKGKVCSSSPKSASTCMLLKHRMCGLFLFAFVFS